MLAKSCLRESRDPIIYLSRPLYQSDRISCSCPSPAPWAQPTRSMRCKRAAMLTGSNWQASTSIDRLAPLWFLWASCRWTWAKDLAHCTILLAYIVLANWKAVPVKIFYCSSSRRNQLEIKMLGYLPFEGWYESSCRRFVLTIPARNTTFPGRK